MNNTGSTECPLAIALAAAVLFLWQYFVATPAMKVEQGAPSRPDSATEDQAHRRHGAELARSPPPARNEPRGGAGGPRIVVDTPMVDGSILLKGARLDDLRLKISRHGGPQEPEIVLWRPRHGYPYPAAFGCSPECRTTIANGARRVRHPSPGHPVTLT
jgi:YidC/Oxa1 family membrane protein insertase